MLSFVNINGKEQAKEGCYDDEVMAFGIALQLNEIAPREFEETAESIKTQAFEEVQGKILQGLPKAETLTHQEYCLQTALARQEEERNVDRLILEDGLRVSAYEDFLEEEGDWL
jgi:hypothetical protein